MDQQRTMFGNILSWMSIRNVGIFYLFLYFNLTPHLFNACFHRNDGQLRYIDRYSDAGDGMCGLSSVQRRTCEHRGEGTASGETT